MIASLNHGLRLMRAAYVLARGGVFAVIDPTPLPPMARLAVRFARLIERPSTDINAHRLAAALAALGPTYVQARPVSRHAAGCGRRRTGTRP